MNWTLVASFLLVAFALLNAAYQTGYKRGFNAARAHPERRNWRSPL